MGKKQGDFMPDGDDAGSWGELKARAAANKDIFFNRAAWKEFHCSMVTTPGSNVDITRLRKQLEGEHCALECYLKEQLDPVTLQPRNQCTRECCWELSS